MSGKLFKFMNKDFLNPRSLRFSRLNYFQMMEHVTGDDWIGDQFEGKMTNKIRVKGFGRHHPAYDAIAKTGLVSLNGTGQCNIDLSVDLTVEIDCFIFSMALGEFEDLSNAFCRKDRSSYNGCFEIIDIGKLMYAVAGATCNWPAYGKLSAGTSIVADEFRVCAGKVRYEGDGTHDFQETHLVETGDPSLKRRKYLNQDEVRIVLIPHGHRSSFVTQYLQFPACDYLTIDFAEDGPFKQHCIKGSTIGEPDPEPTLDNAIAMMQDAREEWHKAKNFDGLGDVSSQNLSQICRRAYQGYWVTRRILPDAMLDRSLTQGPSSFGTFWHWIPDYIRTLNRHVRNNA